jgi:hypothetical protein
VALLVEHPIHWLKERAESVNSPHLAHSTSAAALPLKPVIEPSLRSLTGTSADFKLTMLKGAPPLSPYSFLPAAYLRHEASGKSKRYYITINHI